MRLLPVNINFLPHDVGSKNALHPIRLATDINNVLGEKGEKTEINPNEIKDDSIQCLARLGTEII